VTVTVGAGFGLLFPHADSAATIAVALASAAAADLYVAAGMSGSPWDESSGTGFRAGNRAATNRNLVTILTARDQQCHQQCQERCDIVTVGAASGPSGRHRDR
jgi:hypothetical protein